MLSRSAGRAGLWTERFSVHILCLTLHHALLTTEALLQGCFQQSSSWFNSLHLHSYHGSVPDARFRHLLASELKSFSRVRLCDPIDCSLPGSSVHGIFQAIVLEWIAISFSRGSSQPRARTRVSCIVDRRLPSEPYYSQLTETSGGAKSSSSGTRTLSPDGYHLLGTQPASATQVPCTDPHRILPSLPLCWSSKLFLSSAPLSATG